DRLVQHSDLPWRLILIEDASPDPRIRPMLRAFATARPAEQVKLIENETNLGFVGSVNRGFARAMQGAGDGSTMTPLVLLNSDALVPMGWLSRLLAPM